MSARQSANLPICYTVCMSSGGHKKKSDPSRWITLSCNYTYDLHRGRMGCFFTIRLHRSAPPLSTFIAGHFMPCLTPLGELIKTYLFEMERRHQTFLQIKTYVLMPDHMHVCFWIGQPTKQTPLQYLTTFLIFTMRAAKERLGIETLWQLPGTLWIAYSTQRFHEKKVYTCGNIARWHMDHETRELSHPHALSHARLDTQYPWEGWFFVSYCG